jgi:hypothetical protein
MIEITPRFAGPLDLPKEKGDLKKQEFHLDWKKASLRVRPPVRA